MKKDDVAAVVRAVARTLQEAGATPYDVYIVNPRAVWSELQSRRPDVARHIQCHYPGDGYQQIKVWVPRR